MTIADEIINGQLPDIEAHLAKGELLDDIDEYGFTPLIECAIVDNLPAAELLLNHNVQVDKPDSTGRTALHWAADNNNLALVKMLLDKGASPNAYNRGGQPALVYPLLREQWQLKQLLYQHEASLDFALDFINTKLIGHRYELKGDVDIVNAQGEFIELDYEGFFLEFTIAVIRDSLSRFRNNFAARSLRTYFSQLCEIIYGFEAAGQLLKYQYLRLDAMALEERLKNIILQPVLILPVAYKGHAIAFIKHGNLFAKIDRGENSKREGTVNIYEIANMDAFNVSFLRQLIYKKQTKTFMHHDVNKLLALKPIFTLPLSPQIAGNCSWANMEGIVPTAFLMQHLSTKQFNDETLFQLGRETLKFYQSWSGWDKDRCLDECIYQFHELSKERKASRVSVLGAVLFQACDYGVEHHLKRAEKILKILTLPDYAYVLESYLDIYCTRRLTDRGNNLLKLLDDYGYDPRIGVNIVASPRNKKNRKHPT